MNSPTSSNDDGLPESENTLEQAPPEPSSVPPEGEPTISAPTAEEPSVAVSSEEEPPVSVSPAGEPAVFAPTMEEPSVFASSMKEPTIPAPALPNDPPVSASTKRRQGASGWALLLSLVSICAAGFALWQAYEWRSQSLSLQTKVKERLRESDQAVDKLRASAEEERANARAKIEELENKIKQISTSEGHAAALEALYQQFSRSQEDRIIAEVQQAVEFAGQQLQYAGNIEMALIVLRDAQTRLERNDHGQFASLRQVLKADIDKINRQDTFDMPRTADRLEHILEKIDGLPLVNYEVSADAPSAEPVEDAQGEGAAHFLRGLAADVWVALRSLVKFERLDTTENEPVLLAPKQSAYLRENVKMRLLTARLAMLARDGHTYASDLEQARTWIERFFDMSDGDVKIVVEELRALEAMPVGVIRNELIESATAVARFRTRGGEPPPAPAPPAAPEVPEAPEAPEDATVPTQP
ncbi:MAG: uroporphyrinogen-III C-methyltransferase [Betaproteobacteria bacterium]|nr:uroporphyrinogen-III C-methyltransferase [Betaproteobacteria bacterium]